MKKFLCSAVAVFLLSFSLSANGWYDKTHMAVGEAVHFDMSYNLPAPDVAKLKAFHVESFNHWYSSEKDEPITPALVRGQIREYNLGFEGEEKGHYADRRYELPALRDAGEEGDRCSSGRYRF